MKRGQPLKRKAALKSDPEAMREFVQRGRGGLKRTGSSPLTTRGTPRQRYERVEKACENCGDLFSVTPSRLAGGNGRFCSRACFSAHRKKTRVTVTCPVCGRRRTVPPSLAGRVHCSRACVDTARTHDGSPVFKHGRAAGRQHFKSGQATCQHPACPGSAYKPQEHHVVYEQQVARETSRRHDPLNALALCPGCHRRHHARVDPVPLAALRDENYAYAADLLGAARAYEYLKRRYVGADPRLDALLAEATA